MKIQNYDTTLEELKPCPFCGNTPITYMIGNEFTKSQKITIQCRKCNLMMSQAILRHFGKPIEWLEEVMIKKWNTRVSPDTQREELNVFESLRNAGLVYQDPSDPTGSTWLVNEDADKVVNEVEKLIFSFCKAKDTKP